MAMRELPALLFHPLSFFASLTCATGDLTLSADLFPRVWLPPSSFPPLLTGFGYVVGVFPTAPIWCWARPYSGLSALPQDPFDSPYTESWIKHRYASHVIFTGWIATSEGPTRHVEVFTRAASEA